MTACPQNENVLRYLDEQLSVDEAKRFEAHAKECPFCKTALQDTRGLLSAVAEPFADLDTETFVARVTAEIDAEPKSPAGRFFYKIAAAAAAILVTIPVTLLLLGEPAPTPGEFSARGAATDELAALADVTPIVVNGTEIRELSETHPLRAAEGLTFQYTNYANQPVYFMAFAVDAKDEVHWLYPAYLSEHEDPGAVRLEEKQRNRLMPDIVQPEGVPPGSVRLFTMLSTKKRTVKWVERRLSEDPCPDPKSIFSKNDVVKTWTVPYQE